MKPNDNELKNDALSANELDESELDVSGGRIVEEVHGNDKRYYLIPDFMPYYRTKADAVEAELRARKAAVKPIESPLTADQFRKLLLSNRVTPDNSRNLTRELQLLDYDGTRE